MNLILLFRLQSLVGHPSEEEASKFLRPGESCGQVEVADMSFVDDCAFPVWSEAALLAQKVAVIAKAIVDTLALFDLTVTP